MSYRPKQIITLRVDTDLVDKLAEIKQRDILLDRTYVIVCIMEQVLKNVPTSVLLNFLRSPYTMDRWYFTLKKKAKEGLDYAVDESQHV